MKTTHKLKASKTLPRHKCLYCGLENEWVPELACGFWRKEKFF